MLAPKKKTSESFNDGTITVLNANDGVISSVKYGPVRFGYKTVGATRFFEAEVAGSKIEALIAIPAVHGIDQGDLIEMIDFHTGRARIYSIKQIQNKDTAPKSLYLTLVKTDVLFNDERV